MIDQSFIDKQVAESREIGSTTIWLRELTFSIVDTALKQHYGADYPVRCLQSSCGIQTVLESFGIRARLTKGAACFSQVNEDEPITVSWGGFWDQDHHIWTWTEFNEIVDLTVSQLHLHPGESRRDLTPIPAVWWSEPSRWPGIILYVPEPGVLVPQLPEAEMADLEVFKNRVIDLKLSMIRKSKAEDVCFAPILHGPDSLNDLYQHRHPWVLNSSVVQSENIEMPPWIVHRVNVLMQEWQARNG
jgi:hypothetical protein